MIPTILATITWTAVGLVVVLLVIYLTGVLIALRRAGTHLEELAGLLQQVGDNTQPFEGQLGTINGALSQVQGVLEQISSELGGILGLFPR